MAKLELTPREITGKKSKGLRSQGKVPAALYGPDFPTQMVEMNAKEFSHVFDEVGYSSLIDIVFDGKKQKVLLKEVQVNPVNDLLLHVSMYVVNQQHEITTEIPVTVTGVSPALEAGIGFVVTAMNTLTVRCLPGNLPSEIVINVDNLSNVGDAITVADIKLPEGVELDSSMDATSAVVYVASDQMAEVVEETPAEEAAEGEAAEGEEGAAAEGETAGGEKATEEDK